MGAEQFRERSDIKDVRKAFEECREAALYDYGHAGYTGTIAEKGAYVVFAVPAGHTARETADALKIYYREPVDWIPESIGEAYDDKWGPAVAIPDGDGWIFCGLASS
jgi:hypothetical protein